jgi:pimeloyl-ACP methyl ester carboxylesterase
MAERVSRRRILGAAAAVTAGGIMATAFSPPPLRAGSGSPEQVLIRLFTADQLDPSWFSPGLLKRVSTEQLQQAVRGLSGLFGAFQSVVASGDDEYVAQFSGGTAQLHVTFDDENRIAAFGIAGVTYALAADEQELAFTSGADTLYGTLLVPAGVTAPPAALLIAGSGPTDRNGNNPLLGLQVNTLASLARALADAGVASLRYDKLGAGKTGPGAHGPENPPAFDTFLDEAQAAYAALLARPEVDSTRTLVLGHSEGGLFAELLAQQNQLSGLLLAAPASVPILDTLRRQLIAQGDQAVAAGQLTQEQYDRLRAELDATIATIRADGTIPAGVFADAPALQAMFMQPGLGAFLQQEDSYDPAQIAAQLPASLPALVFRGDLDMNITADELQHLLSGFQEAGNTALQVEEIPNVDHELRQIPLGQAPDLAASYPFSPAVADAVSGFAAMVFKKP